MLHGNSNDWQGLGTKCCKTVGEVKRGRNILIPWTYLVYTLLVFCKLREQTHWEDLPMETRGLPDSSWKWD